MMSEDIAGVKSRLATLHDYHHSVAVVPAFAVDVARGGIGIQICPMDHIFEVSFASVFHGRFRSQNHPEHSTRLHRGPFDRSLRFRQSLVFFQVRCLIRLASVLDVGQKND